MKLTRTIALALTAFSAAFMGVGCDDAENTAAGGNGDLPTIAVSIPSADHGWTGGVVSWAEKAKEDLAGQANIIIQTASGPDEQVSQIENFMTRGVDGMVVLAHESGPLTPTAEKVANRGIYLVNVDRGFEEPVADVYLAGDNAAFGRKSAEFVAERMKERGESNLIILTGVPSTVDTARVEAAMEVFEQYPEIKILDTQPGNWSRQDSLNVMQGLLQKYPDIDAVWAQDDDMAEGVEQAIQEAGRQGIWIFGGAGKKEIVKRVMEGDETFPATITYPPSMIYAGIALAAAKLNGESLSAAADDMPEHLGITSEQLAQAEQQEGQKQVTLDVFLVTPENAEKYYFPDSAY